MGAIKKNLDTPLNQDYWQFVDEVSREVDTWPCWLKGGEEYCISGTDCQYHNKHKEGAPKSP